jgi:hypothetical protein
LFSLHLAFIPSARSLLLPFLFFQFLNNFLLFFL